MTWELQFPGISLIQLRDGVNAALEAARNEKKIGKSLEAHVTLVKDAASHDNLAPLQEKFADQWADLFIVSDVEVSDDAALYAQGAETPIAGVRVLVSEAKGEKCPAAGSTAPSPTAKRACAPAAPLWWPNSPSKHKQERPPRGAGRFPGAPRSPKRKRILQDETQPRKTGQALRWSAAGFLLCAARRKSIRRNLKK